MEKTKTDQWVVEITRDLVLTIAPEELPLFRSNSEAFLKDPNSLIAGSAKDQPLGFGVGEAVSILTPTALLAMREVFRFLTDEFIKSMKQESAETVTEAVKQLFKRIRPAEVGEIKTTTVPPASITADQLAEVRKIVLRQAKIMKLSHARARLLADAVIGNLTIQTR